MSSYFDFLSQDADQQNQDRFDHGASIFNAA